MIKPTLGVLGSGSVGAEIADRFRERGHSVVFLQRLQPFQNWMKLKRTSFIFVCESNLRLLWMTVKQITPIISSGSCLVMMTPFPIGTADKVQSWFERKRKQVEVVTYSEYQQPSRIILGSDAHHPGAMGLRRLLAGDIVPIIVTTRKNAEMIHYAMNAFIATKNTFINQMAQLCEKLGTDVQTVGRGIGLDSRIGQAFLGAGIGFEGLSLQAMKYLIALAKQKQIHPTLWEAVMTINHQQQEWILQQVKRECGEIKEKTFAVWGVSSDSIAQSVIKRLLEEKAYLQVYDPFGPAKLREKWIADGTMERYKNQVHIVRSLGDALYRADGLIVLTDWQPFREVAPAEIKKALNQPLVIDGRNIFPPLMMRKAGIKYISVGRKV